MSRMCARVMVALVCLCVVTARKAGDDPQLPRMIRACGKALSITLDMLCNHQYNSVGLTRITTEDKQIGDESSELTPKITLHNRRTRRSIVNECCVKSCSVSEMEKYCS
uniref:Insulin-like domain-containing protein n=1 Tax=Timema tahoe TaxID=61484 RepID=A0A7R9ITA4_9NEOP|nr:unnamed protein product [Timema tahoe]